MASDRVLIKPPAVQEIEALPRKARRRIAGRIRALGSEPRPREAMKLVAGEKHGARQGRYRIVYSISDSEDLLLIVKVGHRSDG